MTRMTGPDCAVMCNLINTQNDQGAPCCVVSPNIFILVALLSFNEVLYSYRVIEYKIRRNNNNGRWLVQTRQGCDVLLLYEIKTSLATALLHLP